MPLKKSLYVLAFVLALAPQLSCAQAELTPDTMTIERAEVVEVANERTTIIEGTGTPARTQTLTARIITGPHTGTSVTFENDYIQLSQGDIFYLRHTANSADATDYYSVSDPYRLPVLAVLAVVFLALLIIFGGIQGVRGFASLCGSFVLIFYVLLPGILAGYSPILVSIGVASLIIVAGSYITHGFNRTTTAAVFGMLGVVVVTGLGAYIAIHAAHLSGYASEENVYLNFNTRGAIDMVGLLYGGIMIGLLGVLYDIAISQAIAVEELVRAGLHMTRREIYARAIRIGREHIGALVNTLAIAYAGAALPLLLLITQTSTYGIGFAINNELFATEIIRILVGSIGLILAVPITTLIASYMLFGRRESLQGASGESHAHHH